MSQLLKEARRMQKLAGIKKPAEPHAWKWKNPRAIKSSKSVDGISVGDQVEFEGRMYSVEAVGANLAHLALVDPKNLTADEIARGQDGRVSVNPKHLRPIS